MEFRTKVEPDTSHRGLITHDGGIVTLGSCFSDNIATRLDNDLFDITANPMGTLYNPLSIAGAAERLASGKPFTPDELVRDAGGRWHSMMHHGSFSGHDPEAVIKKINNRLHAGHKAVMKARVIFVTLGTAWVYERAGDIVANCHKLPACEFSRRRIGIEETARALHHVAELFPAAVVVVTVSPVRHLADGLHGNNLSKGTLLLGTELSGLPYFPAYEAVNDDLRDYRFYARDMKHPADTAADYVYELLAETYMDNATRQLLPLCRSLTSMAAHRPLDGDMDGTHRLNIMKRAAEISGRHPLLEKPIKQFLKRHGLLGQ